MTTTAHEDQFAPDPDAMEMVEVQISEAPPAALNWLMAKAEGIEVTVSRKFSTLTDGGQRAEFILKREVPSFSRRRFKTYDPAGSWGDGGRLVDKYDVDFLQSTHTDDGDKVYGAMCVNLDTHRFHGGHGDTYLTASARAILDSQIGQKAEVPWFLSEESAS